jgi:hypothetical protein
VSRIGDSAQAYRIIHLQAFSGTRCSYAAKIADADAARSDPNGFYHGMTATHGGQDFVLTGPPAVFIAGDPVQLDLFAGVL